MMSKSNALLIGVLFTAAVFPVLAAPAGLLDDRVVNEHLDRLSADQLGDLLNDPAAAQAFLRSVAEFVAVEKEAAERGVFEDKAVQQTLAQARRDVLVAALKARVVQESTAPEDAVAELARDYYAAYRERFRLPRRIRISHISIFSDLCEPEKAEATLRDAKARIEAGEPFAAVAREVSEAPNAQSGGLIGKWFIETSDAKRSPFLAAAFALEKVGDMTEPLPYGRGIHLLRLVADDPSRIPSFESLRAGLESRLRETYERQQVARFVTNLAPAADTPPDPAQLERLEDLVREKLSR